MSQELLAFGPPPPPRRPSAGALIAADRPRLGRCALRIRAVHATAVTADRVEVLAAAARRGEAVPRTKPTTLAYGSFAIIPGGLQ